MSSIEQASTKDGSASALDLRDVKVHFPLRAGGKTSFVKAVDGISLSVKADEIFGIAGESGCGKSTLARVLIGLVQPTSGEMLFQGRSIKSFGKREFASKIQMVFQDPYSSLNPRRTVGDIVGDPLAVHTNLSARQRKEKVIELLERTGLAAYHFGRYPHEFSGGQRQRIAIARALILDPAFMVLDEPTSALDVSVQAVILNLIRTIKSERRLGCVFITHDLNLMRFMTDRLAVMYLGRVVETGTTESIFVAPLHPYTRALVDATPQPDPSRQRTSEVLQGELPSPVNPPPGCPFHTRCPVKIGRVCETIVPALAPVGERMVSCHLVNPPGDSFGSRFLGGPNTLCQKTSETSPSGSC
jgi:oligopeptide/dipeptide ABC transporter ATP-binding protein